MGARSNRSVRTVRRGLLSERSTLDILADTMDGDTKYRGPHHLPPAFVIVLALLVVSLSFFFFFLLLVVQIQKDGKSETAMLGPNDGWIFFLFIEEFGRESGGGLLRLEKGFPKIPSIFDSRRIRHVNQKWSLIDSNVELNLIIV